MACVEGFEEPSLLSDGDGGIDEGAVNWSEAAVVARADRSISGVAKGKGDVDEVGRGDVDDVGRAV